MLLLLLVLGLQLRAGWLLHGVSLAGSDPPAHFTSGVMVHDYLHSALGSHPLRFAESFYVRYPKAAIGHWPPGYYAAQAFWYSLFGVGVSSARLLSAATAALLAFLLFRQVRRGQGLGIALGITAVLLAMPLMQRSAWAVMSDLFTALWVFLALLAYAELLERPRRWQAAARFVLWSVLAILTKGTAWALGIFALLAPLLAGRAQAFRSPAWWASGAAIVLLAAPFYLWMWAASLGYPVDLGRLAAGGVAWHERLAPLRPLLTLATPVALLLAAAGLLDALHGRWRRRDGSAATTLALVAGAWVLAQALFSFLLPLTQEERALLPSLAPALLLMARGLGRAQALAPPLPSVLPGWAPMLLLASAGFSARQLPIDGVHGYRAAADAIPYPPSGVLTLVSSDPYGEGAFIVERLTRDPARAGVVLRAGQMLAESNWSGSL